ncbi:MAG: hypothetical protein OEY91_08790 [Nitrospirota bacterium]|nr:hypothetical protein [Nitrospirota bacterium]
MAKSLKIFDFGAKAKKPQLKLSARTKNRIFKPQWGKMNMVREDGISLCDNEGSLF